MLKMINGHDFIEVEVLNGDRVYGSSRKALEAVASRGRQPLMTIDIQGAAKLAKAAPGLQPLFMVPPSTDVWMQRLGGRAYMSDGEHDRRLHGARGELEFILSHPEFLIVVNHDVEQSSSEIIRGVPPDSGTQGERRILVKELYEFARSSNI
jgi:guanylate kinase